MNDNHLPDDDVLQLVFGELDDSRQAAVRKSVAEDAESAATVHSLTAAVAAVRAQCVGQVSDDFNDRLRRQMPEIFDRTQAESARPTFLVRCLANWRWIMRSPVSRVAAATTFVLAITGVALWFHGAGATRTFADFVAPILDAKSIQFKTTTEVKGQPPVTGETRVIPPARMRQEIEISGKAKMVMIWDWDQGKALTLITGERRAIVQNFANMPKDNAPQNAFREFLALLLDARGDKPGFKRESLGEKKIDGRHVVGYRLTGRGQVDNVWGDPKTGLPVLIEQTMATYPDAKTTMSDFVFNVEMDESLFSVEPPAGYEIMKAPTMDLSLPTEKDLVETFRGYSQLSQPLSKKDVYSPTGEDYHYEAQRNRFILSSCGEDGIYGNDDDEMMIDGVGTGRRHELYPLQEEKEGKTQTETVLGERPRDTGSIKAKPAKTGVVADTQPIDPKIRELGEAVGKRLSTYSDEETLILKDGQTGRMKIKKNVTPVAEILITAHFVEHGTTFDLECVDATGKAIEGTRRTSGTIHDAHSLRMGLGKSFLVNGEPILSKIQLHPTRQDSNSVAVEVKVLFTGLPTPEEVNAMLLAKGKSGQLHLNLMAISLSLMEYKQRTGHYPKDLADLNDGAFPDSLVMQPLVQALMKKFLVPKKLGQKPSVEQQQGLMEAQGKLQRGIIFAQQLPPDADAYYAGKGVSPGTADTPIFWYRPKDAKKYRVIYADLSVREADTPPSVPNAQPVPAPASPKK